MNSCHRAKWLESRDSKHDQAHPATAPQSWLPKHTNWTELLGTFLLENMWFVLLSVSSPKAEMYFWLMHKNLTKTFWIKFCITALFSWSFVCFFLGPTARGYPLNQRGRCILHTGVVAMSALHKHILAKPRWQVRGQMDSWGKPSAKLDEPPLNFGEIPGTIKPETFQVKLTKHGCPIWRRKGLVRSWNVMKLDAFLFPKQSQFKVPMFGRKAIYKYTSVAKIWALVDPFGPLVLIPVDHACQASRNDQRCSPG